MDDPAADREGTPVASLAMIGIDCTDPRALAEFYHQVLGWPILSSEDGFAMIRDGDHAPIVFWHVEDHQPPVWPGHGLPKQFHLDLSVEDLDAAEARCLELGATRPEFQQPHQHWRVLLDPAGHPFCLTKLG
jgi:predicted enzyme related to lactoylglutathione lyase